MAKFDKVANLNIKNKTAGIKTPAVISYDSMLLSTYYFVVV